MPALRDFTKMYSCNLKAITAVLKQEFSCAYMPQNNKPHW